MTKEELGLEVAKALINTGVEGGYGSVSCSTAGDYPSIGVSQWEGIDGRGDALLNAIPGGDYFAGRSYSDIEATGELEALSALLDSEDGQTAQLQILAQDCAEKYMPMITSIAAVDPDGNKIGFNDSRCVIYAGVWCPTSHYVVSRFIERRIERGYDVNDLRVLANLFYHQYTDAAEVGEQYRAGYENRAENTFDYVSSLDLSTYGVPPYQG